jgi:hypothetical protein
MDDFQSPRNLLDVSKPISRLSIEFGGNVASRFGEVLSELATLPTFYVR